MLNSPSKFVKRPVEIEAMLFNGKNLTAIQQWMGNALSGYHNERHPGGKFELYIDTYEGMMTAVVGDYIIKGVKGEFYPCKPEVFALTYEQAR